MQICAAIKLSGKKVIYGYGNHQMLPLQLAKVDAMATGTWLNVRSFNNRFVETEDMKRKTTWLYCPHALSEYKITVLDSAYNNGAISIMRPDIEFVNEYSRKIYNSPTIPSATNLSEQVAFRFYFTSLKQQLDNFNKLNYNESYDLHSAILDRAENTISELAKKQIWGEQRDFKEIINVNRYGIGQLNRTRGFALEMEW